MNEISLVSLLTLIMSSLCLAGGADFSREFDCYISLIDKTTTLGTGSDLLWASSHNEVVKIMRKADERSPIGYFVYSRDQVDFVKVVPEKLRPGSDGSVLVELDIPGVGPKFTRLTEPVTRANSVFGNLLSRSSLPASELGYINQLPYVENADPELARRVLLNDLEDGIRTVHARYSYGTTPAPSSEAYLNALNGCRSINDEALKATITREIGLFR